MIPVKFPEANIKFSPPEGLAESQVMTIHGYVGDVVGGSVDGFKVCVVAWMPTPQEMEQILNGQPIFISMMNGMVPHFLTTEFKWAIRPA
jgi:hypothetical protein